MNHENEINIEVNPSSNTAVTTLIMLANAGYDRAAAILVKMGVEKEKTFHGIDRENMVICILYSSQRQAECPFCTAP